MPELEILIAVGILAIIVVSALMLGGMLFDQWRSDRADTSLNEKEGRSGFDT